ncbi:hypothetical protein ABIE26_002979 [Pedobacter africanus]|uniref:hypothetical protein n=1 Tax=Pedobacter africanus TaxID=151894 RepID=UPI00339779FC
MPPDRSHNVKGIVIEQMPQCPRAMLVMIQLMVSNDTVCSYIQNDSFRIPGQQIIFDMSVRTGQKTLMGCRDTLPEMVSVYNLRYPEEP